jgi:hypothetical protein
MGAKVIVDLVDSVPKLENEIKNLESLPAQPISMADLEVHELDEHFIKTSEPDHHFFFDTTNRELVCTVCIQYVPDLLALLGVHKLNRRWSDVLQQHKTFLALQQVMRISEFTPVCKTNCICVGTSRQPSLADHDHVAVSDLPNNRGSTRCYT